MMKRPELQVHVDLCNGEMIEGWALDASEQTKRLKFDLLVNGRFQIQIYAYQYRQDLADANIGDGRFAFSYRYSDLIRRKGTIDIALRHTETNTIVFTKQVQCEPPTQVEQAQADVTA